MAYVPLFALIERQLGWVGGRRIAVYPAGTGELPLDLARKVVDGHVTAVAPEPSQLRVLIAQVKGEGLVKAISFKSPRLELTPIPLGRDSVDAIIWLGTVVPPPLGGEINLHYDSWDEFARVLVPGGVLVLAEAIQQAPPLDAAADRSFSHLGLDWAEDDVDLGEVMRMVGSFGFADVSSTDVTDIMRGVWEARRRHPGFAEDRSDLELLLDRPGTRLGDSMRYFLITGTWQG